MLSSRLRVASAIGAVVAMAAALTARSVQTSSWTAPAFADPAANVANASRSTAGALAPGTVPDGTCFAKVTAMGGAGASSPVAGGTGGRGGSPAVISATFSVVPGQSYSGSVGGGGLLTAGGTGDGVAGAGGAGGTVGISHRGGGGGGRTSVVLGGLPAVIAGGGGAGGAAHDPSPAGAGGNAGIAGIGPNVVAVGDNGSDGVDSGGTATAGQGGQSAAGGAGGVNSQAAAEDGTAGTGPATGIGGDGGPDPANDSGGGGGGGFTGGGGGASTFVNTVSGAGGGGGSSWVAGTSPTNAATVPTSITGTAGTAAPPAAGAGSDGSVDIDWIPCLYGLTVAKSAAPNTVSAGQATTWTVSVTHTGPEAMTRGDTVTLLDTLPAGPNGTPAPAFEVVSVGITGGANTELTRGAITCSGVTVGAAMPSTTDCSRAYSAPGAAESPSGGTRGLDPGETLTITYRQIISNTAPCSTITNNASVQDRATLGGTTDIEGIVVTREVDADLTIACYDLSVSKTVSPQTAAPGGTFTWIVTVTNNGPGAMEGPADLSANPLTVGDIAPVTSASAPAGFTSTGNANGGSSCTYSSGTIDCPGGLAAGASQVFTFTQTVLAGPAPGTSITNSVTVVDPRTGDTNDAAADSLTVTAAPPPVVDDNEALPPAVRAALPLTGGSVTTQLVLGLASLLLGVVLLGVAQALRRPV